MNIRTIIGAALILVGGIGLANGLRTTSRNDVVDLGAIRVSTEQKKPIPPWVGGVIAVVGLAVLLSGGSKKA